MAEITPDPLLQEDWYTPIIASQVRNPDKLQEWVNAHGITQDATGTWWKGPALVIVGNDDLRKGVTTLFHDSPTAGHPGIAKTTTMIGEHYWWPGMKDFVTQYIKGCATCQMNKVNTHPNTPPIFPITPGPQPLPFQTIAMDFITKLPLSDGNDTILTITDQACTKATIFIPCKEASDTVQVAKLYATYVFPHYGIPQKIISD